MAARIYRAGVNSLASETNGIQIGQWIFTDDFNQPIYDAEIVHVENIDFNTVDVEPALTVANGGFDWTSVSTEGTYNYVLAGQPVLDTPRVGDILEIHFSTSNNSLTARVDGIPYTYVQATSGVRANGLSANEVNGALRLRFPDIPALANVSVGQTINDRGQNETGTVTSIFRLRNNDDQGFHYVVTTDIAVADDAEAITFENNVIRFLQEYELFVFDPAGQTFSGTASLFNASELEQGEHFSFTNNGHNQGPLYLTGGAGHYLVIPDGIEITANTLQ